MTLHCTDVCCAWWLCGSVALMSAAIFGNVSSIMLRLYRGTEEYHEMLTSIREFIKFHFIPKPLANRLIESYQHSRSFTHGVDMNSVSRISHLTCTCKPHTHWPDRHPTLTYYRATACNATHDIAVAILSVCLSVRLSVCQRCVLRQNEIIVCQLCTCQHRTKQGYL